MTPVQYIPKEGFGKIVSEPPCGEKDPSTGFEVSLIKTGETHYEKLVNTEVPNRTVVDETKQVG